MRWGKITGLAALLALALASLPARVRAAGPGQQTTIVKNVNTVPLVFIALDKHRHFVPGLTAKDIQIIDNGKPQKVQQFNAEGNLPLRIAILMDISNSITTRFQFEQRAADDFLASVLKEGRDEAMVAGFDNTLHVVQPFTDKYERLEQAINTLRPSGGTALYDALFYTAHDDFGAGLKGTQGRNIIVVISDGSDNQSRYSRDEALGMAQDVGTVIYTIGTEPTGVDGEADNVLKRFADQTGGRSFFPIEAHDLGTAFQSIVNDLRHQYVVWYSPDNFVPNGQFHNVQIKVLRKQVTVRTRKGYFARASSGGN